MVIFPFALLFDSYHRPYYPLGSKTQRSWNMIKYCKHDAENLSIYLCLIDTRDKAISLNIFESWVSGESMLKFKTAIIFLALVCFSLISCLQSQFLLHLVVSCPSNTSLRYFKITEWYLLFYTSYPSSPLNQFKTTFSPMSFTYSATY